jgi:hypothetical protein
VWPDLTLWFAVALARNGFVERAVQWLEAIEETMEAGSPRNTVPGQFGEWFDGGSLTNRGMYLSPWTGAKYLWAVAETVCGLDGYRTSGRPHFAPQIPAGWAWTAAARVHLGGTRVSYVIDTAKKAIYGSMRHASAEEPYTVYDAGRDVTEEASVAPADVGIVAFEDETGAVRIFALNQSDARRDGVVTFRDATFAVRLDAGALACIVAAGTPVDRIAVPNERDADPASLVAAG